MKTSLHSRIKMSFFLFSTLRYLHIYWLCVSLTLQYYRLNSAHSPMLPVKSGVIVTELETHSVRCGINFQRPGKVHQLYTDNNHRRNVHKRTRTDDLRGSSQSLTSQTAPRVLYKDELVAGKFNTFERSLYMDHFFFFCESRWTILYFSCTLFFDSYKSITINENNHKIFQLWFCFLSFFLFFLWRLKRKIKWFRTVIHKT